MVVGSEPWSADFTNAEGAEGGGAVQAGNPPLLVASAQTPFLPDPAQRCLELP